MQCSMVNQKEERFKSDGMKQNRISVSTMQKTSTAVVKCALLVEELAFLQPGRLLASGKGRTFGICPWCLIFTETDISVAMDSRIHIPSARARRQMGPSTQVLDIVAERLRRWTANPLGSPRVGSNPIDVAYVTSCAIGANAHQIFLQGDQIFLQGIPHNRALLFLKSAASVFNAYHRAHVEPCHAKAQLMLPRPLKTNKAYPCGPQQHTSTNLLLHSFHKLEDLTSHLDSQRALISCQWC